MQVLNSTVYRQNLWAEIVEPLRVFEFPERNLIAVAHIFQGGLVSTMHKTIRYLTLYEASSLRYKKSTFLDYPIRDLALHPSKPELVIAMGNYDGGYQYAGALLHWQYENAPPNNMRIVEDNRTFLSCHFEGTELIFSVAPPNDHDESISSTYRLPFPLHSSPQKAAEIGSLELEYDHAWEDHLDDEEELHRKIAREFIHETALEKGLRLNSHSAWDMAFLNEHTLATGLSEGKIDLLDLETGTSRMLRIPSGDACVQLFSSASTSELIVNELSLDSGVRKNTIWKLALAGQRTPESLFEGHFFLSQSRDGSLLTTQKTWEEGAKSYVLDEQGDIRHTLDLGTNLTMGTYLHIHGQPDFYAMKTTRQDQQYQNRLLEINPATGKLRTVLANPAMNHHFTKLSVVLADDMFVFQAYSPYSGEGREANHLFSIRRNDGKLNWQRQSGPFPMCMHVLKDHPQYIAFANEKKGLSILRARDGEMMLNFSSESRQPPGVPLSLASIGNKLAVGYDNGLVEIFELSLSRPIQGSVRLFK